MKYIVKVKVKTRSGIARSQSIPLSSKKMVEQYIKTSPMIRSNTNVEVVDKITGKIIKGKRARFYNVLGEYRW